MTYQKHPARAISEHYNNKYPPEAYQLIMEVFEWVRTAKVVSMKVPRHITARQLTYAITLYSTRQYGQLAKTIWEQMNIHTSKDLGVLVEHLVEQQLLGKSERDKFEDFFDILDGTIFEDLEPKVEKDNRISYGVPLLDDRGEVNRVFV